MYVGSGGRRPAGGGSGRCRSADVADLGRTGAGAAVAELAMTVPAGRLILLANRPPPSPVALAGARQRRRDPGCHR